MQGLGGKNRNIRKDFHLGGLFSQDLKEEQMFVKNTEIIPSVHQEKHFPGQGQLDR